MTTDVLTLTFADDSTTYEAFTKIKNSPSAGGVSSMVIVERHEDGTFSVADNSVPYAGSGTFGGSLIGMIVGVLGGPLGVLLGWAAGGAAGSLVDASKLDRSDAVITEIAEGVKPGRNAIIAECDGDEAGIAAIVTELGGTMTAVSRDAVLNELEAQQETAEEAARAAHKAMREQKRHERHEEFDARMAKLREKFHLG